MTIRPSDRSAISPGVPKSSPPDAPVARALLGGAIDYAGLFPPATLSLANAVANYLDYRASPDGWALGRLVLPASRLDDLAAMGSPRPVPGDSGDPIPIAAVVGTGTADEVDAIERFHRAQEFARVETVEVKAGSPGTALAVLAGIPPGWLIYLEVPPGDAGDGVLDVAAARGARAKLRAGGTDAGAIPHAEAVSHFLLSAESRGVPFKATAGLHHPLRGVYPLTYAPDAPVGTMYGYLNLTLAALAAWSGRGAEVVRSALLESEPGAMRLDAEALCWREESFPLDLVASMRAEFFHGFGSCSFREPLDEWPL
jgi:hypothetical protein